jgi:hypothetical protein
LDGIHFDSTSISSTVTNVATVRIVLVLSLIFGLAAELIGVQGAFLCGDFQDKEKIYMSILEGFEKLYPIG